MSTTYPDLSLTVFPDGGLDTFTTWLNILSSDGPLIAQYQAALQAGNTTQANQILTQIPQGTQKIITAVDLNKLTQAIQAVERFYKTDIEPYIQIQQDSWLNIINQFSYQGTWSNGTSYVTNNIVSYTTQGLTLLFIATSNPPLGTAPTNQTYWRVLTIQGQQGPSGPGLSYMQEWNNSTQYQENDAVTYAGVLWVALQSNQNIQPGTNSSYWQSVISFEATTYPIQDTEPLNQDVGGLWFNTQNNPTQYYYLETLDNPITQEMVPAGYQTYGAEGVVLNGAGPLPIASGGTDAVTSQNALVNLGAGVRPNLLDNWYFVGGGSQQGGGQLPVNQRGQTSYTVSGYCIDRWQLKYGISLTLESGGMQITRDSTSSAEMIVNFLPNSLWEQIAGEIVTLSALVNGKLISVSFGAPVHLDQLMDGPEAFVDNLYMDVYGTPNSNSCGVRFYSGASSTWTIQAVKFELGDTQTLAYQDEDGTWKLLPQSDMDYSTQLAKCKQSLLMGPMEAMHLAAGLAFLPTPVTMRSLPVIVGTPGVYTVNSNSIVPDVHVEVFNTQMSNGVVLSYYPGSEPYYVYFPEGSGLSCEL